MLSDDHTQGLPQKFGKSQPAEWANFPPEGDLTCEVVSDHFQMYDGLPVVLDNAFPHTRMTNVNTLLDAIMQHSEPFLIMITHEAFIKDCTGSSTLGSQVAVLTIAVDMC